MTSATDEFGVNCLTSVSYQGLIRRMEPFTSGPGQTWETSGTFLATRRYSEAVPLGYQN